MKIRQGLFAALSIVILLTGSGIWPEDTLEDAVIKNADEAYRQAPFSSANLRRRNR